MPQRFAELLFTPAVRAAQARYGGRADRLLTASEPHDRLGPDEATFLQERDGFHLATVGETGWPYVQFRGGPPGFLHVLDERTIGWADFRGNRQYVSVGNLAKSGPARAAIIAIDHARQRRLKLLGTARIVDGPEATARLAVPDYRAVVERAVLVDVLAYSWNCPQHITPRFTAEEIEEAIAPLRAELAALREENARLRGSAARSGPRAFHRCAREPRKGARERRGAHEGGARRGYAATTHTFASLCAWIARTGALPTLAPRSAAACRPCAPPVSPRVPP